MTNKQAQITINAIKFMLDHAQYSDDVEEALNMAISALAEQSIAQERYEDLCEYFKDCSDQGRSILNDRKEFKSWLDRMKWHVMECNELARELEKLKSAQPEKRTEERTETHACDLIDRQAAIEAIDRYYKDKRYITRSRTILSAICRDMKSTMDSLPSAQPEIIRCKDCKHKHLENMVWTCPFGLPGGENFFCGYGAEPYKGEQE